MSLMKSKLKGSLGFSIKSVGGSSREVQGEVFCEVDWDRIFRDLAYETRFTTYLRYADN